MERADEPKTLGLLGEVGDPLPVFIGARLPDGAVVDLLDPDGFRKALASAGLILSPPVASS